jgi:hypothetical protein
LARVVPVVAFVDPTVPGFCPGCVVPGPDPRFTEVGLELRSVVPVRADVLGDRPSLVVLVFTIAAAFAPSLFDPPLSRVARNAMRPPRTTTPAAIAATMRVRFRANALTSSGAAGAASGTASPDCVSSMAFLESSSYVPTSSRT